MGRCTDGACAPGLASPDPDPARRERLRRVCLPGTEGLIRLNSKRATSLVVLVEEILAANHRRRQLRHPCGPVGLRIPAWLLQTHVSDRSAKVFRQALRLPVWACVFRKGRFVGEIRECVSQSCRQQR